jgi:apolipoprotein N-acyltransferase
MLWAVTSFGLAHSNVFSSNGLPAVAYFAYIPVFLLARRVSWKFICPAGFVTGIASYCFFLYWLSSFHPMGLIVMTTLFALEYAAAFPFLKAAAVLFPKNGWIAQWLVWLALEYLKTLGFTGFHYGVAAYTQWSVTPLIQIADITGIWGINAFVVFVSAWFVAVICDFRKNAGLPLLQRIVQSVSLHKKSAIVWAVCFAAVIVYGFVSPRDYSGAKTVKAALIQPNSDPWLGGVSAMRSDLDTLIRLSDNALRENPDISLVVWPETAFVPRIMYHYQRRPDRERFELVEKLLQYINGSTAQFVIGSDHAVEGYTREGRFDTVDYNAVLLFTPGENVIPPAPQVYAKMHLVPFTEYFPYEKQFPALYQKLLNGDTHMWEPGTRPVVFEAAGLRFASPVCFEDTFGYIGRMVVQNGAQAIVNLSNDAWSKSVPCQYQHLAMALFRSVENRIPSVRSTASGQTVMIDPNGRIRAMAEPFAQTYITVDIPVLDMTQKTLYTRFGDLFGIVSAVAAGVCLLAGVVLKGKAYGKKSHDK